MNIEDVPKYSTNNMQHLERVDKCGCYHCTEVFDVEDIVNSTIENTALCPLCGVDAIIPGITNKFFLQKANERWF